MVTIGMNYEVLEGKEKVFEDAFSKVLEVMKQIPGHVQSFLYKDAFTPGRYLILSEWEDPKAFEEFIHSDRFKKVANWGSSQVLKSRPSHKVYSA